MVKLHFLENRNNTGYVTWGVPWKKGEITPNQGFELKNETGEKLPIQSKISAYWQDGSCKWTTHTANCLDNCEYTLSATTIKKENLNNCILENDTSYIVNMGNISAIFDKQGKNIIRNFTVNNKTIITKGKLKCIIEERKEDKDIDIIKRINYTSLINKVSIEDSGDLKTVIKIEGIHQNFSQNTKILPFILRFILHKDTNYIQLMHTFLCDIDAKKDFIKGIGIEFETPMSGEVYNRHFKTKGDYGYFHEPMQIMPWWRPAIGNERYKKQLDGEFLTFDTSAEKYDEAITVLSDMIIWDSYKLYQDSPSHFLIKKSTGKKDCAYIDAIHGKRSNGLVYIGGKNNGIAVGMKNFWQKYPSSLWVENITHENAKITAWIWSPESEALDMRHYDDKGHSLTCYEGFDEIRSTPYGISNTNELTIWGFTEGIVSDEILDKCEYNIQKPAVLVASPQYYHDTKAFGYWGLEKRETDTEKWLEKQLDLAIEFYKNEIEQRNWYGLFNYGDIMHNYDPYRHSWRYDIGGYAWQNTELVPTLWLWYAFLRSGREDIFTLAYNMSRHCSDVDMYHIGEYKGLGSRHNILHWGCGCKEARIGMAGHHRFTYYLTGDYRIGDILDDAADADFSLLNIDPLRTMYTKEEMTYPTHARTGPDWSSFCSNWLTAWERHNDKKYRDKIITGIEDIKKSPLKLISGADYEYNPATSHLKYIGEIKTGSHLAICMGSIQTWLELKDCLEDEQWNKMLADYGEFYQLSQDEKLKYTNGLCSKKGYSFPFMCAGLGAFSAKYNNNSELAQKIWKTLFKEYKGFEMSEISNYFNTPNLKEIKGITTNITSQWCLNVITSLEFIREYLPEKLL